MFFYKTLFHKKYNRTNRRKIHPAGKVFLYSLLLSCFLCFAVTEKKLPAVPYIDQVIKRKTKMIKQKCLKKNQKKTSGFIMVEMKITEKGKTKIRLMATELKNQEFLNCTLSILKRIRFKKLEESPLTRIYRFFI